MRLSDDERLNLLCGEEVEKKVTELVNNPIADSEINKLEKEFIKYLDYDTADEFENTLLTYARNKGIDDGGNLFEGELKSWSERLLGNEWSKLFRTAVEICVSMPFQEGLFRRSIRCRKPEFHIEELATILMNFLCLKNTDMSVHEILENEEIDELYMSVEFLRAAMIRQGDEKCITYLKEAMTSERNDKILTYDDFLAIAQSGNRDLIELENKLLLAARLQEGLRQAIIETADSGTTYSYMKILETVKTHGLYRYSSIRRGLAVTTGLGETGAPERVTEKFLCTMYSCLKDQEVAEKCIKSENAMNIYLGLWSIAFYDVTQIEKPILELIDEGTDYKIETALMLLKEMNCGKVSTRIAREVLKRNKNNHRLAASVMSIYADTFSFPQDYGRKAHNRNIKNLSNFYSNRGEAQEDFEILNELIGQVKKELKYTAEEFPWVIRVLSKDLIAYIICNIACLLDDRKIKDRAIEFIPVLGSYGREEMTKIFLSNACTDKEIDMAVKLIANGNLETRREAINIVKRLRQEGKLRKDHLNIMEDYLRLKTHETRVAVMDIFTELPDNETLERINRLLEDKSEQKRIAGLEIIRLLCDRDERIELTNRLKEQLRGMKGKVSEEQKMIDLICKKTGNEVSSYSLANGLGLYNPDIEVDIGVIWPEDFSADRELCFKNPKEAEELIARIIGIIEENKDYEFVNGYGVTTKLENCVTTGFISEIPSRSLKLALEEVWRDFYITEINDSGKLLKLFLYSLKTDDSAKPFAHITEKFFGKIQSKKKSRIQKDVKNDYNEHANTVISYLFHHFGINDSVLSVLTDLICDIASRSDGKELVKEYRKSEWSTIEPHAYYNVSPLWDLLYIIRRNSDLLDDETFKRNFSARFVLYKKSGMDKSSIGHIDTNPILPLEYLRAWRTGILSTSDLYREILGRPYSPRMIGTLTSLLPGATNPFSYYYRTITCSGKLTDEEIEIVKTAANRIIEIELIRGDKPTDVSHLAKELVYACGIDTYLKIISGFGTNKPLKTFYYSDNSKKGMMSHLLDICTPSPNDSWEDLQMKAKSSGISLRQLIEAAMFSPRWLELTEKAIGWEGLTSGAYYFLAHTTESVSELVKSKISRFTSVPAEDFSDGAVDPEWFKKVYEQLGKERFEILYEASKYISEGTKHIRSRKISDAMLGKYKPQELMEEICQKRNKDLIICLGLIPLQENKKQDLRERYVFLNNFLKESRQYGAQRRATEERAVKLALENLARTAGYEDSNRLFWSLELDMFEDIKPFMEWQETDGVKVRITQVDSVPELSLESNGKSLVSIPSRLKKDPLVVQLKEILKDLKGQHTRARQYFEQSMINKTEFISKELTNLRRNPVIWSMLSKLVLINGNQSTGFLSEDGSAIVSASGIIEEIKETTKLRIAHPFDLYCTGEWSQYQHFVFEWKMCQPFRQVFRELYVMTDEEASASRSLRYSGNQIMPHRAYGVLRGRGWVTDYENGLQKINYSKNVIAVLYALADWFSPSDIDAPTLEYVAFFDRLTNKEKNIGEIDPIVFSEIMRDVDLAVSVAHAGGVDPETSHSTLEMRKSILYHAIPMFGIKNVSISGNHVNIKGELANYNIHIGSGVIHKSGGVEIAIIPVHSQSRGRIFMPFLDEDPKTAEILTKILLFAEDKKIKDPFILKQLS